MTNLTRCGTALAALIMSAVPVLAQDNPEREGRPRLVFVQVEDRNSSTTNMLIEVRRSVAARICGDEFARSAHVACTINEEEARRAGLLDGDRDDDEHDDEDEYVDANHGHGNDPDGFDEDNPGQSHGNNKDGKENGHRGGNH